MNALCCLFLSISLLVFGDHIDQYLDLLKKHPQILGPCGDSKKGEIEILTDKNLILEIEKNLQQQSGIVSQDKYWIWLRDPVRFPNGNTGMYGRILWKQSLVGTPAVAILPILPTGQIALIKTFRHATRTWEYEVPRGCVDIGETPEDAAKRELFEETGFCCEKITYIGTIYPDTGMTNTHINLYTAIVTDRIEPCREESEAIDSVDLFTQEELLLALQQGFFFCDKKVYFRDPFLMHFLYVQNSKN